MGQLDFLLRSCVVRNEKRTTIIDLDKRQEWMTFWHVKPSWWDWLCYRIRVRWMLLWNKQLEVGGLWGDPKATIQLTRRPAR